MKVFETSVMEELADLWRAGVPARGMRITVRELVVAHMERGSLGAREVTMTVEETVRAACRLVHERGAPDELVDLVRNAALEAVRGHGGTSAAWLADAMSAVDEMLDELVRRRG